MINDLKGYMQQILRIKVFLYFILLFLAFSIVVFAQPAEYKMTGQEYISQFKDDAITEMLMHGVPASITLSQGMLESGNGNSALATYANNHFGIKCHAGWNGPSFIQDDDSKNECFRKYPAVLDSYSDHSDFLKSRARYAFLFDLKITDYKGWARGLKAAGYATDPTYTERLIKIIEENKLYLYDAVANLSKIAPLVKYTNKLNLKVSDKKILLFNNIKYMIVQKDDTFFKIVKDYEIKPWQLLKYNDLSREDKLIPGQKLYLQPKGRKAMEEFHIVQKGETMRTISQFHGIKLKKLYKKNLLKPGEEPKIGDKLWLREKKPA